MLTGTVGTEAKNRDCPDQIGTVGRPDSVLTEKWSLSEVVSLVKWSLSGSLLYISA